jgi:NAD/NADP transhydrogenase beta subunit
LPARTVATEAHVRRSLRLARLLDTSLRIPGTRIRFGLDPVLGLLPGLGDAVAALIGGFIVWSAWRAGAPALVIGRMLANIAVDAVVGSVPVAGTVFDIAFKAHRRNAQLLSDWGQGPAVVERRQRRLLLVAALAALALVMTAAASVAVGAWALLRLFG